MRKSISLLLLFAAAGCSSIAWDPPVEYKKGGGRMVIVPFREGDNRYHFESSIGHDVAERVEDLISGYAKKGTYKIVPFMNIGKEMMEELRNTPPREVDWAKIGEAAKADLVFSGNIIKFELKRPRDVNLFAGTCKVKVFIIRTADRDRAYSRTHTVRHPEGDYELPYDVDVDSAQKMRVQLIMKTAKTCAEPFYPPLKEED